MHSLPQAEAAGEAGGKVPVMGSGGGGGGTSYQYRKVLNRQSADSLKVCKAWGFIVPQPGARYTRRRASGVCLSACLFVCLSACLSFFCVFADTVLSGFSLCSSLFTLFVAIGTRTKPVPTTYPRFILLDSFNDDDADVLALLANFLEIWPVITKQAKQKRLDGRKQITTKWFVHWSTSTQRKWY